MCSIPVSDELNESELGTQQYWDNRYKTEIDNFRNFGDLGDVWFGEKSMCRVCKWICNEPSITKNSQIIDLGCGNGLFLVKLAKENFENLIGVDYSQDAITLAKEIAQKESIRIKYEVYDILSNESKFKVDIIHDKGTYDAISLTPEAKTNRHKYIEQVALMLKTDGFFIITSCNWTQIELESHFAQIFQLYYVIPTPTFQFGGQTGNTITSLVFINKKHSSTV